MPKKITYEKYLDIINQYEQKFNQKILDYQKTEKWFKKNYSTNQKTYLECFCPKHGQYTKQFFLIKNFRNCQKCVAEARRKNKLKNTKKLKMKTSEKKDSRKLTYEKFLKIIKEKISDEFDFIYIEEWFKKNYKKTTEFKIPIYFKNNLITEISWTNLILKFFKKLEIRTTINKKLIFYRFLKEAKENNIDLSRIKKDCLTPQWFEQNYTTKEKTKLTLICPVHGEYQQSVSQFLKGRGCRKCSNAKNAKKIKNKGGKTIKPTFKNIQEKINIINQKYNKNYKLNFNQEWFQKNYKNQKTELNFTCLEHGEFKSNWNKIRDERKICPDCVYFDKKINYEQFLKTYKKFFRDEFDYSLITKDWFNSALKNHFNATHILKIPIKCKKCDKIFYQTIANHFRNKHSCPYCNPPKLSLKDIKKIISENLLKTIKTFNIKIKLITKINQNWYQNYKGINNEYLEFCCPIHGKYKKILNDKSHSQEYRYLCPKCSKEINESKGEREIRLWLEKNNIKFIQEYKVPDSNLRFDFYLPDYNLAIEYDGIQHFKSKYEFNLNQFKETKQRDFLKNKLCFIYKINLLRIPYWDFKKIDEILEKKVINAR